MCTMSDDVFTIVRISGQPDNVSMSVSYKNVWVKGVAMDVWLRMSNLFSSCMLTQQSVFAWKVGQSFVRLGIDRNSETAYITIQ